MPSPKKKKTNNRVRMRTIGIGDHSGVTRPIEDVVKNLDQWTHLWDDHISHMASGAKCPKIDFTQNMVIVIFRGNCRGSGHAVTITKIQNVGDSIVVTYKDNNPQTGRSTASAMTQPFHMVKVQKSNKLVLFEQAET